MAVIVNKVTGQKEEQEQAQPTGGTGSASLGAGPAAQTQKAPGSGRFTNIQQYLGANVGAGQRLAGSIGQGVEKSKQEVEKSLEATGSVRDQIQAEKDRIAQASGFAQQVGQDPTQLAADPNKLQAFTQLRTGQTAAGNIQQAGQQALDTAQSKLGTLQEQSRLVGSEPGRFQLLQQNLGRPSYTKGQQRLDQLLVQTSGGGVLDKLQRESALKAQQATGAIAGTEKDLGAGVADITTGGKTAQEQLVKALGGLGAQQDDPTTPDVDESKGAGALGSLQDALRTRQADFIKQQQGLLSGIQSGLSDTQAQKDYEALQQEKQYFDSGKYLQDRLNEQKQLHPDLAMSFIQDMYTRSPDYTNYVNELQNRVTNAKAPAVNLYQDKFSQEALGKLGLSAGQNLYDLNLADLVKTSFAPGMITEQAVATDPELARYQALAKLAGTDATYLQPGQVNTAKGVEVNAQDLASRLKERKDAYEALNKQYGGDTLQQRISEPYKNAYYQQQYQPKYDEAYQQAFQSALGSPFINGSINPMYNPTSADMMAKEQANYIATKYAEQQRSAQLEQFKKQLEELNKFNPNRRVQVRNSETGGV